jgi:serine/threonine-protein kinase
VRARSHPLSDARSGAPPSRTLSEGTTHLGSLEDGAPLAFGTPLERLGPYRIEQRLGAGGMGEVFGAYDERLQRRVAVKLIRPEAATSASARGRLWREAQAAAALNHPAVVQIYDVLSTAHGDAIVMEYVQGQTLAQLLRASRPGLAAGLALALQVAEGLAAAHARGIVHRDLKTENVMVTPSGEVKMLDFGLARRQQADGTASSTGAAGTYRSMSPEQARALPVDQRSDLFSFGTLLYELFGGRSPFAAASPLETLTNVCSHTPPTLTELDPSLPPALARLTEQLLQKEPGRRPQEATLVADELRALLAAEPGASLPRVATWYRSAFDSPTPASASTAARVDMHATAGRVDVPVRRRGPRALWAGLSLGLVLALGAALWLVRSTRRLPALSVAVPRVTLEGLASEAGETMRVGTRSAVLRALLSLADLVPVAPDVSDAVPGSALEIGRAVAADELLTAGVACADESCRVTLARVGVRTGALLWTATFEVPEHEPGLLPEVVLGHLRRAYPERGLRAGLAAFEVSQADFVEYLALQRDFESHGASGPEHARLDERLHALRARAPLFVEAGVFEAELLRRRFLESRERAQLDRAALLLQRLREQAPADPRPLAVLFEVALAREDLEGAEQALDELQHLEPGDPGVQMQRARLLQRRKADPQRTLELARLAVRRQPSYLHLFRAAQLEARLGGATGTPAARAYLEQLLERHPTHDGAQSLLAEIELLKGSPERAARLYAQIAERKPRLVVLSNLGVANLLLARYPAAEQALRRAAALEPANAAVALNLADVVLLQARVDEARALYRRALALGEADVARTNWQMLSVQAQSHAHLGARREAAEALQRMLAVAGEDGQASLDAAVTYAILGDQASTLASVARALRGGVDTRWLCLPWFDGLRAQAEFQALAPTQAGCAALRADTATR